MKPNPNRTNVTLKARGITNTIGTHSYISVFKNSLSNRAWRTPLKRTPRTDGKQSQVHPKRDKKLLNNNKCSSSRTEGSAPIYFLVSSHLFPTTINVGSVVKQMRRSKSKQSHRTPQQ